jgi:hypothetical protein
MKNKQEQKIKKIFDNKKNILKDKKQKIILSKFEDIIPMYDIFSDKIYPITKINLYYRLIDCHYRFITHEIKKWIENKYKKYKNKIDQDKLNIISNYDIDTLIETSYRVLYEYSNKLGLSISICKRNSFNKFANHLAPYYTKDELLNMGLNMGIIKKESKLDLNNAQVHYNICKKVSKNDISSDEILMHNDFIVKNNLINLISNYSFMGSYFMNRYLRKQSISIPNSLVDIINNLNKYILESPRLNNDYFLYRFVWDDTFINKLKKGDIFVDNGFISTTRDPFYSPGIKSNFGLILIKIKIPSKIGFGLLIENFSLFPKEEELLLPTKSKLKLISKDDKFKYYHTNKKFEKLIKTKYEFEVVSTNNFKKIGYSVDKDYITYNDIEETIYNGESKLLIIKNFIKNNKNSEETIPIKFKDRKFMINYNWFDGTDSYATFYHNDTRNGITFIIYDEYMYPYITIEFGDNMVVNNINKLYYYDNKRDLDDIDFEFINILAYNFTYGKYILYLDFKNFSKVSTIEDKTINSYLYSNLYCDSLYQYFKNKTLFYNKIKILKDYIKYSVGYWKLNKLISTKIPKEIQNKFKDLYNLNTTISELFIDIVENHFYYYSRLENLFINYDVTNIFKEQYVEIDVESYYKNKNKHMSNTMLSYDDSEADKNDNFNLIFRQPIRRII